MFNFWKHIISYDCFCFVIALFMYVIWYKTNRITALVLVLPVMSMKHFSWGSPDLQTFYNPVDVLPFILLALSGRIFALAPTVLCRERAPGSDWRLTESFPIAVCDFSFSNRVSANRSGRVAISTASRHSKPLKGPGGGRHPGVKGNLSGSTMEVAIAQLSWRCCLCRATRHWPKRLFWSECFGGGRGDLVPARVSITDSLHISFVTGLL